MKTIGRLDDIWRYPVKSMRGESLDEVFVAYTGVMGDRLYALSDSAAPAEFPWHTNREQETLVLHQARYRHQRDTLRPRALEAAFAEALNPPYPADEAFALEIESPDGQTWDVRDPKFIASLRLEAEGDLTLRYTQKNAVDCRPLSLFSQQTLAQLERETEMALDKRRFRANFYVDWEAGGGFYENELVGRRLAIGERLEIAVLALDPRCKSITIDPDTAATSPRILKHIARRHDGFAGVYAAVLIEGVARAGDAIRLLD